MGVRLEFQPAVEVCWVNSIGHRAWNMEIKLAAGSGQQAVDTKDLGLGRRH